MKCFGVGITSLIAPLLDAELRPRPCLWPFCSNIVKATIRAELARWLVSEVF